jgi:uncharacterized SAM-binding protein YcdF (DUF218 family)
VFFVASKIFWMLASPINILLFATLAGVMLCYSRHARFGRALALIAILILLGIATLPFRGVLLAPLENRFPQPPADLQPPYGIIVLGGAVSDPLSAARGQTIFGEGGERITEAVILAKRFPQARVVYTSGTNSVLGGTSNEAARARDLMVAMGVARDRVTIEDKARNTEENARFSAAIVHPEASQRGSSSPPPSTCRARWACSRRRDFTRSPTQSRFTPPGGRLTICARFSILWETSRPSS